MMLWSHFWLPGTRNHLEWDKSAIEEIVHFGKWIFLSSILGFLVSSGDRLLLGGMIDKSVLGVYVIAFSIINSVEAVLLTIIARISLPALSEIARDRPQVLQATYYRIHTVVASFAYFCAGVFVMSGQSLVNMLYDSRYAQAGWMTGNSCRDAACNAVSNFNSRLSCAWKAATSFQCSSSSLGSPIYRSAARNLFFWPARCSVGNCVESNTVSPDDCHL